MHARLRQAAWIAIACWLIVVAKAVADEADAAPGEYVPTDNGITPDDLWALAPIERPALPEVKASDWTSGAIDRFVLAGLEADAMEPAPRLSREKLVRRLYFDLWGLPPAPDDVRAALADDSPDAYERLVDRLLASPHYGERWARYWLDLVRFAESNGYERDALKPGAWQYRDWVVQAFNDDKPYDRFVLEQLAGDELPDATDETRVATGFLRVGTFDDEPNDPAKYKYEQLDDLVHATSTAMLGMTIKCARCHDHKFDPIPQRDYYAVLNFFIGGRAAEGPLLAYTDVPDPPPVHLLKSGEPNQPGDVVPPAFLSMLPVLARPLEPPPAGAQTSTRRTQLARWITDRRNPLTARVMVNRLWQHHFGEGLVRTPDNFGMMSASPTHPELLDWLAAEFMDGGWRVKRIHRLILLSSTYRMDSNHPQEDEYTERDFSNQRLWRANRRRLDAEALRDAILATSGELNLKAGGPSFYPPASKEALEGLSKKDAAWGTSPPDEQRRRSIYMMTRRSLLLPLMTTFDFADTTQPCSQRNISIVAPQALALLNNHFVHGQSTALAERVAREAGSQAADRVERAWWLALSRAPTAAEREAALGHLEVQQERFAAANNAAAPTPDAEHLALASLCHVLLNTNEFIYVD
ncbi:MAG: DUF1549 and DUF1553 domain-containing protein [Pirellulales bacterium]